MIFIGEKINGTRKLIQQAVLDRNAAYITEVAKAQADAGADYLDINAGTSPDRETDDMLWLIDTVQAAVETPICIDSSSPKTLTAALERVNKTPMVNSVNADPARLGSFLPLIKSKNCAVIALAMDESKSGMPKDNGERRENIERIFTATRAAGIPDGSVFVDPLIMAVATDQTAGNQAFEMIRWIRATYAEAHITGGFSNISFGLPNRALVNRTFLSLAIAFGADAAVIDPCSVTIIESLKATDMLLGKDRFCRRYTVAAKEGFVRK
jgi:5-methyltetrahydrofolate--homocysteine methyltransferase